MSLSLYQRTNGRGVPLALQVNCTSWPSSTTADVPASRISGRFPASSTRIHMHSVFLLFTSLFSFDFGVIPACIRTKFCFFEFWRQNDDKPKMSAVNSDCFPLHCGLERGFGACIIRILIHFTCDSSIFAWFRFSDFTSNLAVNRK